MKILIIKPSSLGDIIQAAPVIPALKDAFPDARIHWVVFKPWADLLTLIEGIDGSVVWDRDDGIAGFFRSVNAARALSADAVLDLQGLARSALFSLLSGVRRRIAAPGVKECAGLLVRPAPGPIHGVSAQDRALAAVSALTGRPAVARSPVHAPDDHDPDIDPWLLSTGLSSVRGAIGIVPYTRGRSKQWPLGRFAELAALLAAGNPDRRLLLLGSGERSDLFAGLPAAPGIIPLINATSIRQLAAALARCSVVVGPDTGPVHLAAALGVPVVVIFGGSDPVETAPRSAHVTILRRDMPCSPCRGRYPCPRGERCLDDISVQEAAAAAQKWIR